MIEEIFSEGIGLPRVTVIPVEIPEKGLKARVLKQVADPEKFNFTFVGGVRIDFPNGTRYHVWCYEPPVGSYTLFELEQLAVTTFGWVARKKGKNMPNIISVGVEDRALMFVEAIGTEKKAK